MEKSFDHAGTPAKSSDPDQPKEFATIGCGKKGQESDVGRGEQSEVRRPNKNGFGKKMGGKKMGRPDQFRSIVWNLTDLESMLIHWVTFSGLSFNSLRSWAG